MGTAFLYSDCFAWIAWSTWFALLCFDWLVCNALGSFGCGGSLGANPMLPCLLSFGWLYLLSLHALFAWFGWSAWLTSPQFRWGAQRAPHQNLRGESIDLRALVCFANLRDLLTTKIEGGSYFFTWVARLLTCFCSVFSLYAYLVGWLVGWLADWLGFDGHALLAYMIARFA